MNVKACLFPIFLAAASVGHAAQMPPGGPMGMMPPPGMDGPRHPGGPGMGPGMRPGLPDLSEAQQDQAFAIMHAAAPEQRASDKALHKAHEALRQLVESGKYDEQQAAPLVRAVGEAAAAQALLRARTEARLEALLTPEQKAKRAERHAHRPPHREGA